MTTRPAEVVPWAPRCLLGESPRWFRGRWWWVDAAAGEVFRRRPGDGPSTRAVLPWLSLGRRVSLVHPAAPTGVLVAAGSDLLVYDDGVHDHDGPRLRGRMATLDAPGGWLLNDGTGAVGGGLYIGVVAPDRGPAGYLQRVTAGGTLGGVVLGIALSNGLAYCPDRTVLYHADSLRRRILAHRLGPDGEILLSAVHLMFDDGLPDGIATDCAGGLWVALYGIGEVRRYWPDGTLDLTIVVPTPQVTAVALGGADGCDVLITTAREGYDDARSAADPMAGRLFSARAAVAGEGVMSAGYIATVP